MITKAGVKSTVHPGRPDVLLDSPLTINSLRKELIEEKTVSKSLGLELDQKKHESVSSLLTLGTSFMLHPFPPQQD
jgi:hypothetical protein